MRTTGSRQGRRRHLAGLLTALTVTCATGNVTIARAQTVAGPLHTYDIAARPLGEALEIYGRRSNVQLLFSPALVEGRRSHAVKGSYSGDAALTVLLSDSGLVFHRTASNVILVTARKTQAPPAPPSLGEGARAVAATTIRPVEDIQVEDVIVTAGKRFEKIESIPSSVVAATASDLERNGWREFDDIIKMAPSVTVTKTSQPANNSINIRGIGTYAYSIATEASVAVVIDDIPQAFQAAAFSSLVDVQQIEVLRGPQNTLFGKSASAGVINITTQGASDTLTGRVEAVVIDDHEQRLQAMISGPINSRLKFRLAGNVSDYRGNVYNLATRHWLNGQSNVTVRGKLVWTPADHWAVTLSPFATRTDSSCCAGAEAYVSPGITFGKSGEPQSLILAGITPGPDNRVLRMDVDARGDAIDYGAGLKIAHTVNGFTWMSISSYDRYKLVDIQDTDSSDFDFATVAPSAPHGGSANGGYFKISSTTQEFRLTSPGAGRLKYVAGLYYAKTSAQRYFVRGSNDLGDYNGLPALPSTNSTAYAAYLAQAQAINYAAFGQVSYDLTPKLGVVVGLRVNLENIRYTFYDLGNGVTYGATPCATDSPTVAIETCNSDTAVTGRASLVYRFTPDVMGFVTYARGYKGMAYDLSSTLTMRTPLSAGPLKGVPVADAVAAKQPIAPELVDNYELGLRSTLFDRRLLWSLTAFYEAFTGFQAQSRDTATGQNVLNSIGRVTSKGLESELSARLGKHLSLTASGTYTRAIMDDFPNANCYGAQTPSQGCIGGAQDLSGKPLFNAPEVNVNAALTYETPLTDGWTAFATAAGRWQSEAIFNLLQDPDSVQKSYGIVNLSGGVRKGPWKATLFVNNLFDQRFALTRGRDTQWNISQSLTPPTNAVTWKPARDSARYAGIRFTASY